MRVAINKALEIPEGTGLFGPFVLGSNERARIRIAGILPRPCPGIDRVIVGNLSLDVFGLDREKIHILGPGQGIDVFTSIPMKGRVVQITGYVESDDDLCSPDAPQPPEVNTTLEESV